jgi:hypothetical protein
MRKYKYSDEAIAEAVKTAISISDVMRTLGIKMAGGNHTHISRRIKKLGLDTSHFLGQRHLKGTRSAWKKPLDEILTVLPDGHRRPERKQLLRAMLESGIEYKCAGEGCGISEWQGKSITLDIDHIDGNWLNNVLNNLRFMCPNCHSQTDTFGAKNRH